MSSLVINNTEEINSVSELSNLIESPKAQLKTDEYDNNNYKKNEIEYKKKFQHYNIYDTCKIVDPLSEKDYIIGTPVSEKIYNGRYSYYNSNSTNKWEEYVSHINNYGTIHPHGYIIDTPKKINLKLKPHQKRTLYEMNKIECSEYRLTNRRNIGILSNDVGSGKSIEVLSLIANSKRVKLWNNKFYCNNDLRDADARKYHIFGYEIGEKVTELDCNLLIIPHNIYNQWAKYVENNTDLNFYGIDKRKKIANLFENKLKEPKYDYNKANPLNVNTNQEEPCKEYQENYTKNKNIYIENLKKEIKNKIDQYDLICVKSTMFKDFSRQLNCVFGKIYHTTKTIVPDKITSKSSLISSLKGINDSGLSNIRASCIEKSLIEKVKAYYKDINKWYNTLDMNSLNNKGNIEYSIKNNQLREGYIFQRVIIDEVDSITVPAFPDIVGKFTWFVSSSINNILYPRGKSKWISTENHRKVISSGIVGTGFLRETLYSCTSNESSPHCYDGKSLCRIFKIILKHNPSFVKDSVSLPEPIINYIPCFTSIELYAVSNCVSSKILKALNAGDTAAAKLMLGYENTSEETSFIEIVTMKLNKELKNFENDLKNKEIILKNYIKIYEDFKINTKTELTNNIKNPNSYKLFWIKIKNIIKKLNSDNLNCIVDENINKYYNLDNMYDSYGANDYVKKLINDRAKNESHELKNTLYSRISSYKETILNYKSKIMKINIKINGIKERLENTMEKDCPICVSTVKDPCVTPCCKNVFCFECLGQALKYSKNNACPMCRTKISMNKVNLIVKKKDNKCSKDNNKIKKENELPTKMEALISYITENKDKRILVFSEYDFCKIIIEFENIGIKFSKINGSSDRIRNILEKFQNGEFQVLLLNANNFGAGLNLQFTDDIVIFHRMAKDLERQVIGRAQRLGRTLPLRINYLCHDNEKKHYTKKKVIV
jgi:hypothetical protein